MPTSSVATEFTGISPRPRDKTQHRIAIVGAGASGIVCARELKKRVWSHVTVFERSHEAGGKTRSTILNDSATGRQAIAELGTYCIMPSAVVQEIIEDNGLADDIVNHRPIQYYDIARNKASSPLFSTDDSRPFWKKLAELLRYSQETSRLALSQKPGFAAPFAPELLWSVDEWLTRNDFEFVRKAMFPLFCTTFGGPGFKDIPALYLMKYEGLRRRLPMWRRATATLPRMRLGNQEIWKRAARALDIRYGEPVQSIGREQDALRLHTPTGASTFDSVIWTTSLPFLDAALPPERNADDSTLGARRFYRQVRQLKRAVLTYRVENLPRDVAWIFPDVSLAGALGESYGVKNWPGTDCYSFYPWMNEGHTLDDLDRSMRNLATRLGGRVTSTVGSPFVSGYHPYFDAKTLESGAYDSLESEQGRGGVYLCGEIMSGILLPSTTEYARNLIERFF